MTFKEHFKKKDWVYYLTIFVGLTAASSIILMLFSRFSWVEFLLCGLTSGIVSDLIDEPFINKKDKDRKDAVEEDKRMDIDKNDLKNNTLI